MTYADAPSQDFNEVREVPDDRFPALVHPVWRQSFPWLVQGTTTRGERDRPFDLGLFSTGSQVDSVRSHWAELLGMTGARHAYHAQQVHEATVRCHELSADSAATDESSGGLLGGLPGAPTLVEPCDGHVTRDEGALLAVTVADCVPVFVVDSAHKAVGILHAGWRGAAAGVLEEGLRQMASAFGTRADEVDVHLGPSICGSCYQVGPEVFEALAQPVPHEATPIDLRTIVAIRALEAGVERERVSISGHCTRCTNSGLFSHRGGDAARQIGFIGVVQ